MMRLKSLILVTGLVLTTSCSVVKPPPLPIPEPPKHTPFTDKELNSLRSCISGDCIVSATILRKTLKNYQELLTSYGECIAVVKSTH